MLKGKFQERTVELIYGPRSQALHFSFGSDLKWLKHLNTVIMDAGLVRTWSGIVVLFLYDQEVAPYRQRQSREKAERDSWSLVGLTRQTLFNP